eukprot:SAG11_NODE_6453_length_1310_cov_1.407927_1_plen_256_part_00
MSRNIEGEHKRLLAWRVEGAAACAALQRRTSCEASASRESYWCGAAAVTRESERAARQKEQQGRELRQLRRRAVQRERELKKRRCAPGVEGNIGGHQKLPWWTGVVKETQFYARCVRGKKRAKIILALGDSTRGVSQRMRVCLRFCVHHVSVVLARRVGRLLLRALVGYYDHCSAAVELSGDFERTLPRHRHSGAPLRRRLERWDAKLWRAPDRYSTAVAPCTPMVAWRLSGRNVAFGRSTPGGGGTARLRPPPL